MFLHFLIKYLINTIFSQENEYFQLRGGLVLEVNSLCGSRSLMVAAKQGVIKKVRPTKPHLTLVRDERERLLSAYNKKLLAVHTDWKKHILLVLNGLNQDMCFDEFIQTLQARKDKMMFVDKHFKACTVNSLKRVVLGDLETIDPRLGRFLKGTQVKSSVSLLGEKAYNSSNFSPKTLSLLVRYLDD